MDAPSNVDVVCVGVAIVTVPEMELLAGELEGSERTSISSESCQVASDGCSRHS